ncbi:ATPase domain containing protein [Aphelenchoides besseyi]|nr:ATPase domain containing protein [Aphelenchoides besseyi]
MDDNDGFADFNDDDYNFRYEEEDEAEFYMSTIRKESENVAPIVNTRPEVVLNEPSTSVVIEKQRTEKRARLETLPFGAHPLDWFANSEMSPVEVKRRKIETAQIHSANLLAKLSEKKNKQLEMNLIKQTETLRQRQRTTGCGLYYTVSDSNGINSRQVEGEIVEEWQTVRKETKTYLDEFIFGKSKTITEKVIQQRQPVHTSSLLWTEKYAPKSFLELLTPNEQNQNVLQWLKLWEPHVFGRKRTFNAFEDENRKQFFETEDQHPYLPKRKILLLHGPSGSGKSTLARICALQTGYRPLFFDAGEFANAAEMKTKLTDIVGNTSISSFMSKVKAPPCIIIESIDHASTDIINYLVTSANSKLKKNSVLRPIIVICNNFFHPNLRKLRAVCGAINIANLNRKRAIQCLEKICTLEDMNEVKRHTLVEIFDSFCGDMRRCLGHLHLLCSSTQISNANSNQNENSQYSIFEALDCIFTTNSYVEGNRVFSQRERSRILMNMLSKRTDIETLYDAVFHNASLVGKLKIMQLNRICNMILEENLITSYIQKTQSYTLMRYTNIAFLLVHFMLATPNMKRITYNLSFMKNRERLRASEGILESLRVALKPPSRLSTLGFQIDLLPALLNVVQTNCPTSSTQIQHCTSNELEAVKRVASVMTYHGLTYVASLDKTVGELSLDPRLDELVSFPITKNLFWNGYNKTQEATKKIVLQLLENQGIEQKVEIVPMLQMPDRRIAGLELLNRGLQSRSTKNVTQFTTTDFNYKRGNSTAIRCNVKNDCIFSVIIGK